MTPYDSKSMPMLTNLAQPTTSIAPIHSSPWLELRPSVTKKIDHQEEGCQRLDGWPSKTGLAVLHETIKSIWTNVQHDM